MNATDHPHEEQCCLPHEQAGAFQRGECATDAVPAHATFQGCVDSRRRHGGVHSQHEPVDGLQRLLWIRHHLPLELCSQQALGHYER
ncbi:hypothetical protein [Streptomyces sp. NPDC001717]|uniref:hypothetical protein n=1 Tax=Streptomyces sp. NPDC001717 TaxID=3364604 RepID=UPI003696E9FC